MRDWEIPEFCPHPLLPGGHAQTLGGFLFSRRQTSTPQTVAVRCPDGDQVLLHDDSPPDWRAPEPAALLIHGLAGSADSVYMSRVAEKLRRRGFRTFRMDQRGCGAGVELARLPYHAGRSEDAKAALAEIARLCPGSPLVAIGFSLAGNLLLKMAAELTTDVPTYLAGVVAVCPPVDLHAAAVGMRQPANRWYERYFLRLLRTQLRQRSRLAPQAVTVRFRRRPRSIMEFDDSFTGPVCGFGSALNYYQACSAAPLVERIHVPTLILAAADDPLVPARTIAGLAAPSSLQLALARGGGHLGFLARVGQDPDVRWMDWRIVDWSVHRADGKVDGATPVQH